jgi:hypothetical protein
VQRAVVARGAVELVEPGAGAGWTRSVLAELSEGPKRYALSRVLNVDHKQLGRALRRLQQARLVCKLVRKSAGDGRTDHDRAVTVAAAGGG